MEKTHVFLIAILMVLVVGFCVSFSLLDKPVQPIQWPEPIVYSGQEDLTRHANAPAVYATTVVISITGSNTTTKALSSESSAVYRRIQNISGYNPLIPWLINKL